MQAPMTAVEALQQIPLLHRRLRSSSGVGELLARASEEARLLLSFERAVLLAAQDGRLTATEVHALADPAGDAWRRTILGKPVRLAPGTIEAEAVRRATGAVRGPDRAPSSLAERLGLRAFALGVVVPEAQAIAVLVLDRPAADPVLDEELQVVDAFCHAVATTLELVVMRERARDLDGDLRQYAVALRAMVTELLDAPVTIGDERAPSLFGDLAAPIAGATSVGEVLSPREVQIAELLAQGRTNRQIADELVISIETVKTHVGRVLRKLGAGNRVEAATQYLRHRHDP